MFDLFARAEIVEHVVDEIQQLQHEISCRHFFLFAEIDHLAFQSPAHCTPLVLLNQSATIEAEAEVIDFEAGEDSS